jgi:hypothetical protein
MSAAGVSSLVTAVMILKLCRSKKEIGQRIVTMQSAHYNAIYNLFFALLLFAVSLFLL